MMSHINYFKKFHNLEDFYLKSAVALIFFMDDVYQRQHCSRLQHVYSPAVQPAVCTTWYGGTTGNDTVAAQCTPPVVHCSTLTVTDCVYGTGTTVRVFNFPDFFSPVYRYQYSTVCWYILTHHNCPQVPLTH